MSDLEALDIESTEGEELSDAELPRILEAFENDLQIPDQKIGPFVILLVGLIGSGKTTVAKELENRLPLVRLRADDMREILSHRGYNLTRTRELMVALFKKYLLAGYGVIADNDGAGVTAQKLVKQVQAQGVPIVWLHVMAPEELILERLQENNTSRLYKGKAAIEMYHRRKPLHENLTMSFACTFDTSKSLDEQLDEAEQVIRAQLGIDKT